MKLSHLLVLLSAVLSSNCVVVMKEDGKVGIPGIPGGIHLPGAGKDKPQAAPPANADTSASTQHSARAVFLVREPMDIYYEFRGEQFSVLRKEDTKAQVVWEFYPGKQRIYFKLRGCQPFNKEYHFKAGKQQTIEVKPKKCAPDHSPAPRATRSEPRNAEHHAQPTAPAQAAAEADFAPESSRKAGACPVSKLACMTLTVLPKVKVDIFVGEDPVHEDVEGSVEIVFTKLGENRIEVENPDFVIETRHLNIKPGINPAISIFMKPKEKIAPSATSGTASAKPPVVPTPASPAIPTPPIVSGMWYQGTLLRDVGLRKGQLDQYRVLSAQGGVVTTFVLGLASGATHVEYKYIDDTAKIQSFSGVDDLPRIVEKYETVRVFIKEYFPLADSETIPLIKSMIVELHKRKEKKR